MRQHGNEIFMGKKKRRPGGEFRPPPTGSTWLDVGTTATPEGRGATRRIPRADRGEQYKGDMHR
jgi:hypothetical protein